MIAEAGITQIIIQVHLCLYIDIHKNNSILYSTDVDTYITYTIVYLCMHTYMILFKHMNLLIFVHI